MDESIEDANESEFDKKFEEKFHARLVKRGYWCEECDCLAPPSLLQNSTQGGNGVCPSCGKNPLDQKKTAPTAEEVAHLN